MSEARWIARDRKRLAVSDLRDVAQEVGVTPPMKKPDLSKGEFQELHASVKCEAGTPELHLRLVEIMNRYEGMDPSAVPRSPSETTGFRLRSTSCLFTWNNESFAASDLNVLWNTFVAWLSALTFVSCWTATMERSLKSLELGRIHLHAFVEFTKAVDWNTLENMRFEDGLPNAAPTRARGDNIRTVKDQGHFYVWANKIGTLKVLSSGYEPWKDYAVKGLWIDSLWSEHKLDHATYLEYAMQVRVGFLNRSKQVEAIQTRERVTSLQQKRNRIAAQLAPLQKQFKAEVVEALQRWNEQYKEVQPRYSFLVLRGASRTGKSTLARSLGMVLKFGGAPFVQTVQSAVDPDLRNYDEAIHSFILFDNVNSMKFILDQRALFQANNDVHTLGESKTGCYSYSVWLHAVRIVVTVDMSAKWDSNELWIKENCMEIFLKGPSWQE